MKHTFKKILCLMVAMVITVSLAVTAFAAQSTQDILDQMAANSMAWHTATTQAEKDALAAQNAAFRDQLSSSGANVQYDAAAGSTAITTDEV